MDEDERNVLWSARKEALWSMLALKTDESKSVFSTDIAVPLSRLADIIGKAHTLLHTAIVGICYSDYELLEVSKQELDELGLFASILGHIGDGNFHESILYNHNDPRQREAVKKCVNDMVDRALEMEGT